MPLNPIASIWFKINKMRCAIQYIRPSTYIKLLFGAANSINFQQVFSLWVLVNAVLIDAKEQVSPVSRRLTQTDEPLPEVMEVINSFKPHELDQAFFDNYIISREITIPVSSKGQLHQSIDSSNEYYISSTPGFTNTTLQSVYDAAAIFNRASDVLRVNIIPDLVGADFYWDRRDVVGIAKVDNNYLDEAAGLVVLPTLLEDFIFGYRSDVSMRYALPPCNASSASPENFIYRRCVKTALHEMMHLFGVKDLSRLFDSSKYFFRAMDQACGSAGTRAPGQSIMF